MTVAGSDATTEHAAVTNHAPTLVLRHPATQHTLTASLRWLRAGGRVFAYKPHGIDLAEQLRTRLRRGEGLSLAFQRNLLVVTLLKDAI